MVGQTTRLSHEEAMQKLVQGIHKFQNDIFSSQRELFEHLATGQYPETLFITCGDSRINPNLITQTDPGDLFILRNAGNIIPPYSEVTTGEAATIEFAVAALGVHDIIVCGHSHCGAVKGLLNPEKLTEMPAVAAWLHHAEPTWKIVSEKYRHLSEDALLGAAIQENVLVQLENLRTHPSVVKAIAAGKLKLHAWMYKIETGEIFAYDQADGQYHSVTAKAAKRAKPTMRISPDEHAI
jgi:carbonic anhydrase